MVIEAVLKILNNLYSFGGKQLPLSYLFRLLKRDRPKIEQYSDRSPSKPAVAGQKNFEGLFWEHDGSIVHKWHHYLPIYEKFLREYKGKPVKLLEIGVSRGGSLSLWRKYFGPDATIYGVDVDTSCEQYDGVDAQVRIGSQDNVKFISAVVQEMGGVNIVVDDGSHISRHIRTTFNTVFPLMNDGGIYIVEDLHAAYWPKFGGGYQSSKSFMSDISQMYDDMHHWYHSHGQKISSVKDKLSAIHLYDSMAIFEKNQIAPPRHSRIGTE